MLQVRAVRCAAERAQLLRDGGRRLLLRRLPRRGEVAPGHRRGQQEDRRRTPRGWMKN